MAMRPFPRKRLLCILAVAEGMCLSACERQPSQPEQTTTAPLVVTDDLRAKLAEADGADGQVDRVISKCVTCKLQMKGKPAHAATAADYTVHLCSAFCKTTFEKDPAKALLALTASENPVR